MKTIAGGSILAFALLFGLVSIPPAPDVQAQTGFGVPEVVQPKSISSTSYSAQEVAGNKFRRQLVKAAASAARKGEITHRQALRIRIASFSPAFLERAETLCVIQMAFSGESPESLPMDEEGKVIRTAIDWEGLATFLERILPLILVLLEAFL